MAEGSINVTVDASYVRHLLDSVPMELADTPLGQRNLQWHAQATVQLRTLAVEVDVRRHERDQLLQTIAAEVGALRELLAAREGARAAA